MSDYKMGPKIQAFQPDRCKLTECLMGIDIPDEESSFNFQQMEQQKKMVQFDKNLTIFLRYEDEVIHNFKVRLKKAMTNSNEIQHLNPTLYQISSNRSKSCIKS